MSTNPGTETTVRTKPKIVDLTKSYPFQDLEATFSAKGSYKNALSLLRAVNRHLELEPVDHVYPKVYKTRSDEVCRFLLSKYELPTPAAKRTKLLSFSAIYSRILWKEARNPYRIAADKVLHTPALEAERQPEPAPDWNTVLPILRAHTRESRREGTTYVTAVICTLYSHGWVLRTEQIFHTCLVDLPEGNWLDLDQAQYHIRHQKNKAQYSVPVPEALVQALRELVAPTQRWLLPTRAGGAYSKSLNPPDYDWPSDLPDCKGCRASFRTWLKTQPDADEAHWCRVLGHSQGTAENYYIRPQEGQEKPKPPSSELSVQGIEP